MSKDSSFSQQSHLNRQFDLVVKLHEILIQENQSLSEKLHYLLPQIATDKNNIITEINAIDQQMSTHKNQNALRNNQKYSELINEIKSKLKQCQKINNINAEIVKYKISSINRFEQTLKTSTNKNSLTYDDKGKTKSLSHNGNKVKV